MPQKEQAMKEENREKFFIFILHDFLPFSVVLHNTHTLPIMLFFVYKSILHKFPKNGSTKNEKERIFIFCQSQMRLQNLHTVLTQKKLINIFETSVWDEFSSLCKHFLISFLFNIFIISSLYLFFCVLVIE